MKDGQETPAEPEKSDVEPAFHPLQPPPEPPSKLYEEDDFDLYADIEAPNTSKLAPPPEPPALLLAIEGDEKDDAAEGSDEDAGLIIDDRNDVYDPEMPTSPPSPPPQNAGAEEESAKGVPSSEVDYPPLESIPQPPSPSPPKVVHRGSNCPNQGLYSKQSMAIAKGGASDSEESGGEEISALDGREVVPVVSNGDCSPSLPEPRSPPSESPAAVKAAHLSEGELEEEEDAVDKLVAKSPEMPSDDVEVESVALNLSARLSPVDNKSDEEPTDKADGGSPSVNGSQESLNCSDSKGKSKTAESDYLMNSEADVENDLLELGCEEEKDGLVDITDEEISNYERSWELEDGEGPERKGGSGLEGLDTEAISDCEDPTVEMERLASTKPPSAGDSLFGNKGEEGEIVSEEKTPVQWKKLSKGTKERSYRGDREVKNKEKNKEIIKKKEKRKELERYDVRKLISEKPRRKVDEFGRDISSSPSRSPPSRSGSQGRGGRKRRSEESRGRSKERGKERERARSPKEKPRKENKSKERVSRSPRSKKRRRSRSAVPTQTVPRRSERGRSREKANSREQKRRKKSPLSSSCSSCSCSSCEREKRLSKKLTVIVTNEGVGGGGGTAGGSKRSKVKSKQNKEKKGGGASPRGRRRLSPVPSKEVFTSGDNILVSVNFKSSSKGADRARSKEKSSTTRRKRDDDAVRKKKDKGTKENQPMRSIVTKKSNRRKLNTKNMKPVAIIDLDTSPFRETILSPKEVIVLTDSDSEDKSAGVEMVGGMPVSVTGPKTPPEPLVKFNIVNKQQQQLRTMTNPLLDSLLEQLDGEDEEESESVVHKGPNTPPEPPPVPYDPFEPTKSRSPTPDPDLDSGRRLSPAPLDGGGDGPGRRSPQQQHSLDNTTTPPKLPQHVAPKTPSPLHSPPKTSAEAADKPKLVPFQPTSVDSDDDSVGGGGGGGDSPYSPDSAEGDDLFEPPPGSAPKGKTSRLPVQPSSASTAASNSKIPPPKTASTAQRTLLKRPVKTHKDSTKKNAAGAAKKEVGVKLDEDQLKILDELPNSAVEMQVKDKFLKKLNRQERVVEEVKMVLKPHYAKKHVTKEEYKEILRKAVPKICHSRTGEINPIKIQRLVEAYVKKYRHKSKKKNGSSAIPPLRQNKQALSKTMWC